MRATGWWRFEPRLREAPLVALSVRERMPGGAAEPVRVAQRLAALGARYYVEVAWGVFALANWAAMITWPDWETIPFHFVWISLTIVYGFRVWSPPVTYAVLWVVMGATGASLLSGRVRRQSALGRAVRGAVDVGDVPGDGLARASPGRRPRAVQGVAAFGRRCSSGSSASSTTPRTSCGRR